MITGEVVTSVSPSLGIYASKVANPDSQQVKKKPLRAQQHKIRKKIREKKLASQRVCDCGYKPLGGSVEVHFNRQYNSAKVAGLETCGSVWACPVCRTKIMSGRADELREVGEAFRGDGGNTCMVTLTVPHYSGQSLSKIIGTHKGKTGLAGAFARMRQHRRFRELKQHIKYVADTRALEITHGRNGFHAHVHMILYYDAPIELSELETMFYGLWADVCQSADLEPPSRSHGVKVTEGEGEYLAKWGAPCELTSVAHKEAKNGNRTMAEMEAVLLTDDPDATRQAEIILKEYYSTMAGRRLLTWGGKNLKKEYLDVPDMTDEEHAQDDEHGEGERLYVLPFTLWKQIYYAGVGEMLSEVERCPETGLYAFCKRHGIDASGAFRSYRQYEPMSTTNIEISDFFN